MKLAVSAQARSDLRRIVAAISKESPARAHGFVDEIEQRWAVLTSTPEAYALLPRYADRGIRRIVHGNYLIFYRASAETVTILRVLHGAMDLEPILRALPP